MTHSDGHLGETGLVTKRGNGCARLGPEATCSRCGRLYFTDPTADNGECCICNARLRLLCGMATLAGAA